METSKEPGRVVQILTLLVFKPTRMLGLGLLSRHSASQPSTCRPSVGKEHARTLLAAALSQLYGTEPRTDAAHPTLSAAAKHHVQPAMGRQALE